MLDLHDFHADAERPLTEDDNPDDGQDQLDENEAEPDDEQDSDVAATPAEGTKARTPRNKARTGQGTLTARG